MYTDLRQCLGHAVTRFDRTRRKPQNPYALGHYLSACDRVMVHVKAGNNINDALAVVFTKGPLLDYVRKFVAKHHSAVEVCRWFALCTNPAVKHVGHPILGAVPVCQRCADKLDL